MQRTANVSWIEDTTLGRIVIPEPLPEGFALFYTTADFDGRTDDPELLAVLRDRFGIEASLETCNQIHSAHIHRAPATRECDALFTDQRGVALGIKVADCLPISLCDPAHRVIANIHSGWRGAAQQITAATLDTLARETAFHPPSSYAYLGPSIRVCCFEVGDEVAVQFDGRWIDRTRGPKPHIDLVRMTEAVLRDRGVANVIDTGLCTRCDAPQPRNPATAQPRFHSYRCDKRSGRNLAIAAQ
ncbi:MAG: polyphenol oxidase family protein [Acidobacteriota bacterium]